MRSEQLLEEWSRRIDDLRAHATPAWCSPSWSSTPSSHRIWSRTALPYPAPRRGSLALLAERGILEPYEKAMAGPGQPRRFWVASELIAMATNWSPV